MTTDAPGQELVPVDPAEEEAFGSTLHRLPPEIGSLLLIVGIAGMLLPGPVGSPFVIAGGVALWPRAFDRVERWFCHRFPRLHRSGMRQIHRFLADLDRRYPGSVR